MKKHISKTHLIKRFMFSAIALSTLGALGTLGISRLAIAQIQNFQNFQNIQSSQNFYNPSPLPQSTSANLQQNTDAPPENRIDIIGVANRRIPIQVLQAAAPNSFNQIFNENLSRTGKIELLGAQNNSPYQVSYQIMDLNNSNGPFMLRAQLKNLDDRQQLNYEQQSKHLDVLANRFSDFLYEHFFGKKGNFSTRLSYIIKNKEDDYELVISDANGRNTISALKSPSPIMSVSWSPDGTKVAYVSFEKQKPVVFIQNLSTGERQEIANYTGNNSAPSWHPSGQKIALALSQTGHTQIYEMDLLSRQLKRLSFSAEPVIDTEPYYSNDGGKIYFTSDRGGSAQIYQMSAEGESNGAQRATRVTFSGEENTSPKISPNGRYMIYISKNRGAYQLHRQNLSSGDILLLSQTYHDESPSFSANGDYVIYATRVNGKQVLIASDIEGQASHKITSRSGQIRQPAWGPFPR